MATPRHPVFSEVAFSDVQCIDAYRKDLGASGQPKKLSSGLNPDMHADELRAWAEEAGPGEYAFYAVGGDRRRLSGAQSFAVLIRNAESEIEPAAREERATMPAESPLLRDLLHELRARREQPQSDANDQFQRLTESHAAERSAWQENHRAEVERLRLHGEEQLRTAIQNAESQRRSHEQRLTERDDKIDDLQQELATLRKDAMKERERESERRRELQEELADLRAEMKGKDAEHRAELREVRHGDPEVNSKVLLMRTEHELEMDRNERERGFMELVQHPMVQHLLDQVVSRLGGGVAPQPPPRQIASPSGGGPPQNVVPMQRDDEVNEDVLATL